jgi:hypothetical protein
MDNQGSIAGRSKRFSIRHPLQTACGTRPASYPWIPKVLSQNVNRPEPEADNLLPSIVKVRVRGAILNSLIRLKGTATGKFRLCRCMLLFIS